MAAIDFNQINAAFISTIQRIDVDSLPVSSYSKVYLKKHQQSISFITSIFQKIIYFTLREANKKPEEICLLDFGGGIGLLSIYAKKCGFKKVFYNDIYDVSCKDFELLSDHLQIATDKIICGNIDTVREEFDCLISMDVIEHIYDLNDFLKRCKAINQSMVMVHFTGANPHNPLVNYRLSKSQQIAELKGYKKEIGQKERDTQAAYLSIRKDFIKNKFPHLDNDSVANYAQWTRGLNLADVSKFVSDKRTANDQPDFIAKTHNTCDPYTGNWHERLLSRADYKALCAQNEFQVTLFPSFYNEYQTAFKKYPIFLINQWIKWTKSLQFAPGFYLVMK